MCDGVGVARMKTFFAAVLAVVVVGCGLPAQGEDELLSVEAELTLPAEQTAALLNLVNDPSVDAATLQTAGATSTTAKALVTARAGVDGVCPSADDFFFTTVAQVDAVPGVGEATLQKWAAYGVAHPSVAPETVKGVFFKGWQVRAVLYGVNHDSAAALDALFDARSVTALVAARPVASVTQLGGLSYVGASTLTKLAGKPSFIWWAALQGGGTTPPTTGTLVGTFDGVTFDALDAPAALLLANAATSVQLDEHGVDGVPATALLAHRPYTTLAQVAAVGGIGKATMAVLQGWAHACTQSGQGSCIDLFTAKVTPNLATLLFMSESDRPLDVISFPGAGTAAPTPEQLMALVGSEAGSTGYTRPAANFIQGLEYAADTTGYGINNVNEAFHMQLVDVTYIVIEKPRSDPYHAEVDVYLMGRTLCGDLVGIHAISVET